MLYKVIKMKEIDENEILNEIMKTRGFIEDFHLVLAKKDLELLNEWNKIWIHVFKNSKLDKKTVALIRLAVVSLLGNERAIEHSIDQAITAGADEDEILDSIKISFIFGGVTVLVKALSIYKRKFNI